MYLLAIDTSAKTSTVSIVCPEKVVASFQVQLPFTHSQTILPLCEQMLATCSLSVADMDGFAVSVGPGSFTGLRIGIAAIKGMAFGSEKPCIGVSTLDALAQNVIGMEGTVCAVMDARRDQVYQATYRAENGKLCKITEDRAILLSDLTEELQRIKNSIILVGDGADLCYNKLKDVVPNLTLAPPHLRYQLASSVGQVALSQLEQGGALTALQLAPQYLRLPQAQREREERLAKEKEKTI